MNDRRPRVLSVLWTFEVGGAETLVVDLIACQRATRHEPVMAVLEPDGPLRPAIEATGVELHTLTRARIPQTAARFLKLARAARPDIIHAHNAAAAFYAGLAGRRLGVPVIATSHGQAFTTDRGPLVRWVLRHWVDRIIAVSDQAAAWACEHLARPATDAAVILNGINTSTFAGGRSDTPRHELGLGASTFLIGTVARLDPVKEQERQLAALRILLDEGRDIALAIAGEGPHRAFLEARLADLRLAGRAFLLGLRRDIPELLRSYDAFCLSSRTEGLPIAMLEAMAAGTPCVMTAVGGIAETVRDGVEAVLVAPEDDAALAAGFRRMMDEPETRRALSDAALRLVRERYSIERMAEDYAVEYDRLLAGRGAW